MHKIFFFIYCFVFITCIYIPEIEVKKNNLLSNKDNNLEYNKNDNKFIPDYINLDVIINKENDSSTNSTDKSETTHNLFGSIKLLPFNYLHLTISFIIFPIVSLIFLLYDIKEDKNLLNKHYLSAREKAREDYTEFKNSFITKGKYFFSWFVMKYEYPLTNALFVYNYNHPRYLRFMLFLIRIFLNTLIVIFILFKFLSGINNIMNYTKFVKYRSHLNTVFISIAISFLMHIFYGNIINSIFEYDKKRRTIFKEKLENLRKYVYNVIKSDILLNSKWHTIKTRMIVFSRICGTTILNKLRNNTNKYKIYTEHKQKNSKVVRVSRSVKPNNNAFITEGEEVTKGRLLSYSSSKTITSLPENEIAHKKSFSGNNKNKLLITKGVEPFSFSRFGVNNLKLKTLKKIEYIKNRYIKIKNVVYGERMDIDSYEKTFDNLSIEELESYTYISTEAMISKLKHINTSWTKLLKNLITNIILFIILVMINVGLVLLSTYKVGIKNEAKNKPKWLMEIFLVSFTIDVIFFYVKCFYISIRIANLYGKKVSNCFYKLLFNLFVEKYLRYLYRMRLLIMKYKKELDFI